jgi:biotin carboxyl carrier protein
MRFRPARRDPSEGRGRERDLDVRQYKSASRQRKERIIVTNLVVPKTGGMNTTKVNLVRWLKNEGDRLQQGEGVVELETEKVSYELDAPVNGILLKIVVREPAEVEVGGLLGLIGDPGDSVPAA